ncbi:hypothetical protein BV25DRAFT_1822793 [Artomyces pyxidatus]|uniref:Uncharacterized protein n=1 Tax=Artomyces pyxidatus TaxID=48021 RepID=A0ACB8T7D3_9AGAM|nr:hypothetical protein BV25DRAFT_1822793 [Artomyces pyxidatus]
MLQNLVTLVLKSVKDIHDHNIVHLNLSDTNILVLTSANHVPSQIVIVDLAHCRTSHGPLRNEDRQNGLSSCVCCLGHQEGLKKWDAQGLPDGLEPPKWDVA